MSRRAKITPQQTGLDDGGRTPRQQWSPHPSLQWALDAVTAAPAFVRSDAFRTRWGRHDVRHPGAGT